MERDTSKAEGSSTGVAATVTPRDRVLILVGVLGAQMLAGLDQTIVATAGPAIQQDLQVPAGLYAWITTAYLIGATVMLPVWGKLSDIFGRKPILVVGVVLFLLGSVLAGLSPGTMVLIAARGVQGLGAASLFTTTMAVIADLYPPAVRGKYMGLMGAVMGISSVIGPLVGGILTDTLGWHWVFFVNLPIGGLALWFILSKMPRLPGRGRTAPIDIAGAVWLVVAVVPLLVALSIAGSGEEAGATWWLVAVGGVGAVLFLRTERRAADPILDLRLFRDRVIGRSTATVFVLGAAFLFSMIFLPLYLVNVVGVSATSAGLALLPLTLGIVAGSVSAGQLVSRIGHAKTLLCSSLAVLATGYALMGWLLTPETTHGQVTLLMILVGIGTGPTLPLYTLIMQNAADPRDLGVVTSASMFSRSMGQVVGVTFFGVLFALTLTGEIGRGIAEATAGLSSETRAVVVDAAPVLSVQGEGAAVAFDAEGAKARILETVGATEERSAALDAIDRIDDVFASALTRAIERLYRVGIGFVVVAFLLTLAIPERRLGE